MPFAYRSMGLVFGGISKRTSEVTSRFDHLALRISDGRKLGRHFAPSIGRDAS